MMFYVASMEDLLVWVRVLLLNTSKYSLICRLVGKSVTS